MPWLAAPLEYGPPNLPGPLPPIFSGAADSTRAPPTEREGEVPGVDPHHGQEPSLSSTRPSTSTTTPGSSSSPFGHHLQSNSHRSQPTHHGSSNNNNNNSNDGTSYRQASLVPSGFECVAHPVFFQTEWLNHTAGRESSYSSRGRHGLRGPRGTSHRRYSAVETGASSTGDSGGDVLNPSSRRREDNSGSRSARQRQQQQLQPDFVMGSSLVSSELAIPEESLQSDVGRGCGDGGHEAPGVGVEEGSGGGGREVDRVCPICLGRFEQPVTLTSCLHSFCHTCILGWYEHTVAVALARGGVAELQAATTASNTRRDGRVANSNNNDTNMAPAPYRCPLCQVPGPFFLAVQAEAPPTVPSNTANSWHSDKIVENSSGTLSKPKLKFKLLGARTVVGEMGGRGVAGAESSEVGPSSGGSGRSSNDGDDMRRAVGYPTMAELRAAVRTQLALAAAVSSADETQVRDANENNTLESGNSPAASSFGRGHRSNPRRDTKGRRKKPKSRERALGGQDDRSGGWDDEREELSTGYHSTSRSDMGGRQEGKRVRDWSHRDSARPNDDNASLVSDDRQRREKGRTERGHFASGESGGGSSGIRHDKFSFDPGDGGKPRSGSHQRRNRERGFRRIIQAEQDSEHSRGEARERRRGKGIKRGAGVACLGGSYGYRRNSSSGCVWEPGSTPAEEALKAVERMLEVEKEKLRSR